jgi:hypothetical protein
VWRGRGLDRGQRQPLVSARENNHRTLVSYKESTSKEDPSPIWTGLWRDPRFSPRSDGGHPENALTGTLFGVTTTGSITVPA